MNSKIVLIEDHNETSSNKPAIFNINRTENFLEPDKKYNLGILRFYIPTNQLSPISTTQSYVVGIGHQTLNNVSTGAFRSVLSDSNNMDKFVNTLNLSLSRSYYDFLKLQSTKPANTLVQVVNSTFIGTFTPSSRSNLGFSITSSLTYARIAYVKLTLKKFKINQTYVPEVENIGFSLSSPNGTTCQIITNKTPDSQIATTNKNIVISDYADLSQNGPLVNNTEIRPIELLAKFSGENPIGTWLVNISQSNLLDEVEISFDYEIVYLNNDTYQQKNFACHPPFFSIGSDDRLSFNYSEAFINSGLYLLMNTALNDILNFDNSEVQIANGAYRTINLGSYVGLTNEPNQLNALSILQDKSSSSKSINDLFKLQIKTTLPIESSIDGKSQKVTDNILTDFVLDQFDNQFYTYSLDYPNRLFKVLDGARASQFQISIWIKRKNGTSEILQIGPNQNTDILLAFYEQN